jgi:hypothetical protein
MSRPGFDFRGRPLTTETIAHLRELNAARTQGEWEEAVSGWIEPGVASTASMNAADAEFITAAANHMGALLDAAEERDRLIRGSRCPQCSASEWNEASRLRAELAEARAVIDLTRAALHQGGQTPSIRARAAMAALAPATQREVSER